MRAVAVFVVCLWGLAVEAGALSNVRLVDGPGLQMNLMAIAQGAADDAPIAAPPLLPAPGGEVAPPTTPRPHGPRLGSQYGTDPYANGVRVQEVAVGALMVLAAHTVSFGVMMTMMVASIATAGDGMEGLGYVLGSILVGGLLDVVLVPFAAALGAYWMTNDAGKGHLGRAIGAAWLAQLTTGALFIAGSLLVTSLAGNDLQDSSSMVLGLYAVVGLIQIIGVPSAASWALHQGNVKPTQVRVPTRRQERLVTHPAAPLDVRRQGSTVLAFTF